MSGHWLFWLLLSSLLGFALACDVAERRIPNWLVLAGLIAGLGFSLLATEASGSDLPHGGVLGAGKSLLGALVGLSIMFPLYLLRALGAGDAKLMAAIGAFLGPMQVAGAALLAFVAGGVLSLVVALWSGSLLRVLGNLRLMSMAVMSGRSARVRIRDVQTTGRLPYAIAISIGTGLQIWLATLGAWPFV